MTPPRNIKQVHAFVVLVKYYRDIWARRLNLIRPLTALTSTKVTFKWTDVEQKAFDKIKQIVSRDTLLIYPDFNKRFDMSVCRSGIRVPIAYSLLGGGVPIPEQRLCWTLDSVPIR